MMREIRFRGKRLDNGEWVCGNLVTSNVDVDEYRCIIIPQQSNGIHGHSEWRGLGFMECWAVDPATVGQYTGYQDKSDAEIYDDDIYKFYSPAWERTLVEVIQWPVDWTMLECEGVVIGNTHDNPELLEEASK